MRIKVFFLASLLLLTLPEIVTLSSRLFDVHRANVVLSAREQPKSVTVTRVIGGDRLDFTFNPSTSYFLYRDEKRQPHIGHYWKQLPLLEQQLDIPFVRGEFSRIPAYVALPDSPELRAAQQRLNALREFPLSPLSACSLATETYVFEWGQ